MNENIMYIIKDGEGNLVDDNPYQSAKKIYLYGELKNDGIYNPELTTDENEAKEKGEIWGLAELSDLLFEAESGVVYKDFYIQLLDGIYKHVKIKEDGFWLDEYEKVKEILSDELDEIVINKVKEVNDYYTECGMDDLIHTTTIDEKLLNHANWLDFDNNQFCMEVEFGNFRHVEIANYLCNSDEYYMLFTNRFLDHCDVSGSLMKFREYLRDEIGRGQNVSVENVQKLIDTKDYDTLKSVLSEMWLIPLCEYQIEEVKEKVENGLSARDIYAIYEKRKDNFYFKIW